MSTHEKLSAASNDRKSRLAQLKSLKRKQAPTDDSPSLSSDTSLTLTTTTLDTSDSSLALTAPEEPSITTTYLSGRNFDPETRNLKLGYTAPPISDPTSTLEYKAAQLALETKAQQDADKKDADKGLDLFKLQPKRPNWDLKRDLKDKMAPLDGATENAIARAVRERVEGQKKMVGRGNGSGGQEEDGMESDRGQGQGDGEEVGMEGSELVEAMHLKEQEEERERQREVEDEMR